MGGSDQWGNIVAGVDLVRRTEGATVHALTIPLITDRTTGKKFGKSEGNAVWLDPEKTSPYAFYQFWFNTSDENVTDYLAVFTEYTLEAIDEIVAHQQVAPAKRYAQSCLARTVTAYVHGEAVADTVARVSQLIFTGGDVATLGEEERVLLRENAPTVSIRDSIDILSLLVRAGLAGSKREARTFIADGAVTLGEVVVQDSATTIDPEPGLFTTLRRGKRHYAIVTSESEE